MSDTEIITRIRSGDDALFARLIDKYSGYVWALCSTYIRNPTDREDVAQEIFVQCYHRLDTLKNPAAFGGWLSQLARRRCLMWLRASKRRDERLARYENQVEVQAQAVSDRSGADELRQGIRDAIDTLPDDYREALLLRYAEGYTVEDAASFLGVTPVAMRKRLERAQHMLKDRMWDQVEPALAQGKHKEGLAGGILASIPFGKAPWLSGTATAVSGGATVASKLALLGGIAVMSKKTIVVVTAIVALLGLCYVVANKSTHPQSKASPAVALPTSNASLPAATEGAAPSAAPRTAASPPVLPEKKETPQPKTTTSASVAGHVKDEAGQPIAGADIHLEVNRDRYGNDVAKTYRAKTDAGGAYEVKSIDTFGSVNVFGFAEGYVMQRSHEKLEPGARLKGVDLTLPAAAFFVAGRVVTDNRAPIPGATVDTLYFGYNEDGLAHTAATGQTTGNISSAKFVFTVSDKDGYFKLAVPNEGLCDLRVTKFGYGPGFFPRVATGTTDALIVLGRGGAIAGKVTGADGKPVAGATVRVTGEALPGGLPPSTVKIQALPVAPVMVITDAEGKYIAEELGEAYTYTVAVPASERATDKDSADNVGQATIAASMRELDESTFGPQAALAQKTGVLVKAGQTTPGIDLVLGANRSAIVRGVVTDRASGKPVCPVVVTAGSIAGSDDSGKRLHWFQTGSGGTAVTNLDGSYELTILNLTQPGQFRISYAFMTEGGSSWEQPDEEVALLKLAPGDERDLSFAVDAPVTVPVKYVSTSGAPLEGIAAAMRQAGGRGGCGGTLVSDADGRVTFHGIRSGVNLQAVAWKIDGHNIKTLGASEPFSGQPGETVPELTVVCRMPGGVEATLTYPDGRPVANTEVASEVVAEDSAVDLPRARATTDANGGIRVEDVLPEGLYRSARVSFIDSASGQAFFATAQNFRIEAGAVTNLGSLVAQTEKDWTRVIEAADWGHKGNETIAAMYSKDALNAMSDPTLILKAGMALYDAGKYRDALDAFTKMSAATDNALYSAVALVWQGQMLDLLGKRNDAIAAYSAAANMGVTSQMQHDQFGMRYAPSEYAQERIKSPFVRIENRMP